LGLSAYHVPDSKGLIKLDAMENPYTWPVEYRERWLEELRSVGLNRYPDPAASRLKEQIRRHQQVPAQSELLLGNGSDEIIQILLMAVAGMDTVVMSPEPSFVMYRQIAVSLGLNYVGVGLRSEDFALDLPAMLASMELHRPAVIFLAHPNNPTGNAFAEDDVLAILQAAPGLVVLDEAYAPFADSSFMDRLPDFPNLLVMRTFSKLGLAGLRLGFLAGDPAWIHQLDKLRLPYNIGSLTQCTAEFALSNPEIFVRQVRWIREERVWLRDALDRLPGVKVYPSAANFLCFALLRNLSTEVFLSLRQSGVLVKNLAAMGGALGNCLRVTVGTPEENRRFIHQLSEILDRSS
jgi:histidinol-phosphate aminotransferase